jgi:hypothetical protein
MKRISLWPAWLFLLMLSAWVIVVWLVVWG